MTTQLTSHVLDAVAGKSAIGIRVSLFRVYTDETRESVFDTVSDQEGRIAESIDIPVGEEHEFELVFHGYDYLVSQHGLENVRQNMRTSVVRFTMQNRDTRYHIPLVLSPHSYTVWWSE